MKELNKVEVEQVSGAGFIADAGGALGKGIGWIIDAKNPNNGGLGQQAGGALGQGIGQIVEAGIGAISQIIGAGLGLIGLGQR